MAAESWINTMNTIIKHVVCSHWSLSAVTHAPFHASVLRPASQVGPMHKTTGMGKLMNAALLSLINEASVSVCCATLLLSLETFIQRITDIKHKQ